jgi:solute carrier family 35 protein E1
LTSAANNSNIKRTISSTATTRRNTVDKKISSINKQVVNAKKNVTNTVSSKANEVKKAGGTGSSALMTDILLRLKIGFYFGLWYALNVIYNIINKKLLNIVPAPLTVGTFQFGVGALYSSLLWLTRIRPTPKLTQTGKKISRSIGFYHSSGQLLSMVSLGAGPVSFTHIVKALEPFFSAVVSALVFGEWMKPQVYATLIPVVGGVGYACMKERSFSWLAFWTAMASNIAFALRAVVSKSAMGNNIGENLNSVNLFGVVTWDAFFLSIPIALMFEYSSILPLWNKAVSGENALTTVPELWKSLIISGLFHYLNNEVMYLALGNVHPVTLAVGNTMKRVFIIVASVLVFRNPVSSQAMIGSTVGIGGVLLYSLTKQHYENLAKKA